MTAATYTFTLSAAQSSAVSMVVAMRAKTGSSIPGNASRWQGGTMPQATLNWAAGATAATTTVNTAPNSTVDGNAEYEWYKVSSTPSDLTLSTASLPTVTITDDDTGGSTGKTFGPTDGNSPAAFDTEVAANFVEFTFRPNVETIDLFVGGSGSTISDAAGDSVMMRMSADNSWTAYTVRNGSRSQIGTPYTTAPSDGQKIRFRQNADQSVDLLFGGTVVKPYSAAQAWPSADGKTPGTWGRLITTFSNGGSTKAVTIGPVT